MELWAYTQKLGEWVLIWKSTIHGPYISIPFTKPMTSLSKQHQQNNNIHLEFFDLFSPILYHLHTYTDHC